MSIETCRELTAQAWCAKSTSGIEMDSRLAEGFAKILLVKKAELAQAREWIRMMIPIAKDHVINCEYIGRSSVILNHPRRDRGQGRRNAMKRLYPMFWSVLFIADYIQIESDDMQWAVMAIVAAILAAKHYPTEETKEEL